MAQPESILVGQVIRRLAGPRGDGTGGLRCLVLKLHGSEYGRAGVPDLLVIRPDGRMALVEIKLPGRTDGPAGNGLSALQLRWLRVLAMRGAICGVACSPDEAELVVMGRPLER